MLRITGFPYVSRKKNFSEALRIHVMRMTGGTAFERFGDRVLVGGRDPRTQVPGRAHLVGYLYDAVLAA